MNSGDNLQLSRRFLVLLFLISLALRVIYIFFAIDNSEIGTWYDSGAQITMNLMAGKGYVSSWDICENFRSFRTPVLPLTLYVLWSIFGYSIILPKLLMALLSALTCVLVALLGSHLFDARVGRLAGIAAALCTTLIRWAGTLGTETMAVFFLTLGVYWVCAPPLAPKSWGRYLPAGLALGLLCLTRPLWMPLVALIGLGLLWSEREEFRVRRVGVLAVGVALVLAPWVARNALIHRTLMVASTDSGIAFVEANNPQSFRQLGNWVPHYAANSPDVQAQLKVLPEAQLDRFLFRKGLANIAAEPRMFLQTYALRLWYLWKPSPPPHMTGDLSGKHILLLNLWWGLFDALLLAALFLARPWKNLRTWPSLFVLMWATLAIPLFSSQLRYRAPLEPFILLFGAAGWFALTDFWRSRNS